MGRWMDWTLDDNMVGGLFFCATLAGRRGGHTPFVQAGAEISDSSAKVIKPDPRCSWKGHSRRVVAGVRDESAESCGVVQPLRVPSVIRSARRTSIIVVRLNDEFCATSTNGCLDLRRRAFALGGQVSAEWSRCPGSMARVLETVWLLCDEARYACEDKKVVHWCRKQGWHWTRITGVDSGRSLRFSFGPDPESKICEKLDPESLFNFGSSRSLCGHFLSENMGKLRLDWWL